MEGINYVSNTFQPICPHCNDAYTLNRNIPTLNMEESLLRCTNCYKEFWVRVEIMTKYSTRKEW